VDGSLGLQEVEASRNCCIFQGNQAIKDPKDQKNVDRSSFTDKKMIIKNCNIFLDFRGTFGIFLWSLKI
jgi:hypothetical protein